MVLASINALKVDELKLGHGLPIESGQLLPSLFSMSAINLFQTVLSAERPKTHPATGALNQGEVPYVLSQAIDYSLNSGKPRAARHSSSIRVMPTCPVSPHSHQAQTLARYPPLSAPQQRDQ